MHSDPRHAARQVRWLGGLPRRDLLLLPLLALVTLIGLLVASELGARLYAPAHEAMHCIKSDATLGFGHGRPHCIEAAKIPEGPEVTYAFNACGYRSTAPCPAPKPAGVRRVAVMGASFAMGYVVPYEESFGSRAERGLTTACKSPVEVHNLAALATNLVGVYHELDEALSLQPDMIVLAILPYDLEEGLPAEQLRNRDHPQPAAEAPGNPSLLTQLATLSKSSRALTVARHLMFEDRDLYARTYLLSGEKADFLRVPLSPSWEKRLGDFDELLGAIADKAKASGVPVALLLGPQRAQAVLMTEAKRPPGIDPTALPARIGEIARHHGVLMIDTTQDFAKLSNPERMIYTVDGHPDGAAGGVIAGSLVHHLTRDPGSPFGGCARIP